MVLVLVAAYSRSSEAAKWKTINLVRERVRQNGCKTMKEEEAELALTFDRATAGIRRQLHVLVKELVDTEATYVKVRKTGVLSSDMQ